MSTTIDTLQIEIQSNASNAAKNIEALAKSLGNLKTNGGFKTAVNNLNNLRKSLHAFVNIPSSASKIASLAQSLERLKSTKFNNTVSKNLTGLADSLKVVQTVNLTGFSSQIQTVATALGPLSQVKSGGIGSMVTGLSKIKDVVADLDETTIGEFAEKVEELTKKVAPLSEKMTPIAAGFKAINAAAKSTTVSLNAIGNQINIGTLNFATLTNMLQKVKAAFDKIANLFRKVTSAASEWEGISNRFGRGFGSSAQETYEWIQKCNEAMGMNVQQFMQYSSVYATMLTGFGVATRDASKMALGYAELTYDIWAGYNDIYKTYEEAADAVKSAIAGEVEPIRKAGFTVIESTLEQTAANHGLKVSLAKATEAQKSYLRYLTLVDQAHSQSLVGTYAKELNTAEGLTRTLSMQVKSLAQSFGSLLLPVLAKVVPYLQAFLEIAIECTKYLGSIFGFTIQDVDWSNYNAGASSAVETTKDLEKAVQDVKNATLGIDELNVISPPSASGAGATGGSTAGSGFEGLDVDSLWDESILDSVNDQVKKIRKELSGFEEGLKDTLSYLVDHKDTLLAIGAVFLGWNLVTGIKKVGQALKKLGLTKIVKTTNGLKTTMTGLGKTLTVVPAGILEFVAIKDSVEALYLGCENVVAEITTIGVTAVGAGVAMYAALGPAGIALAAVVGLTGAVVGLKEANDKMIAQYGNTAFFDNGGYAIDNLAGIMENLWSQTAEANNKIIDLTNSIQTNDETLLETYTSMQTYMGNLTATGTLTKTEAENMKKYVSDFVAGLKQNLELDTQLIFEAFGKLTEDAAKELGLDVTEMTNTLLGFKKTFADETNELETKAQGYFDRMLAGEILDDKEVADLQSTLNTLTAMSDEVYENQKKVGDKMTELESLDFKSVEDATAAIEGVAALGQEMLTNADLAEQAALDSVDKLQYQADVLFASRELDETAYNSFNSTLEQYRLGITAAYDKEEEKIKTELETMFGYIDAQVQQAGLNAYESAGEDWENLNWFEKLLNPNKEDYTRKAYESTKNNIMDPLFDALTGKAGDLGLNYESGKSVTDDFYDGLYYTRYLSPEDNPFYDEAVNAVEGYKKGVTDNAASAVEALKQMAKDGIGAVVETQDSHSPAVEYIELAKDAVDGYVLGVNQNIDNVKTVWADGLDKVASTIAQKLDKIVNDAAAIFSKDKWSGFAENVSDALSKIKVPKLKNIELKVSYDTWVNSDKKKIYEALGLPGWPKLAFAANGGVFDAGSLIWAGERGAEVAAYAGSGKTGVMNVQQMQDAVYEGVYAAVSAAMSSGNSRGNNQPVIVYLDGKQLTGAVEKRQHERGASLMGNQVYGY